jgi:hypothetical protein
MVAPGSLILWDEGKAVLPDAASDDQGNCHGGLCSLPREFLRKKEDDRDGSGSNDGVDFGPEQS